MLFLLAFYGIIDLVLAAVNNSQFGGWQQPRGGVVVDTLFMEGGVLFTQDDRIQQPQYGTFFELRFCSKFDITKNSVDEILQHLNETLNSEAPTYVDGYLFADKDEFYTYGGMAYSVSSSSSDTIFHAGLKQPNPAAVLWKPSLDTNFALQGVTNYITNGAGVSIPSESLGFYFGGMKSSSGGNLSLTSNPDNAANTLSNTLIEVDMTTYSSPIWTSSQLPSNIPGRAEAALAWIPAAKQGLLVAIGGVIQPADLFAYSLNDTQIQQSNSTSPGFMTQLPVYDISSQTWYLQNTSGTPPSQRGQFCTVVTSASNDSSYQIHVYGGWNGLGQDGQDVFDEIWILSVPSFKWIKVSDGVPSHGRRSHICVSPAPNQMISVGGVREYLGHLESPLVDVFDLNSLSWTGIYDPKSASDYKVPSVVEQAIRASDGSTLFADGMDPNLMALLKTPYSKEIVKNYPYSPCGTNPPKSTPRNAIIGGVVGGVVALVLALGLILYCCRRRKSNRRRSVSTYDSSNRRGFISRWIYGTSHSTSGGTKPYFSETTTEVGDPWSPPVVHEADGYFKPKYELPGNVAQIRSPAGGFASHVIRSPGTPQSDIAEVASTTRYELSGGSESIRNHPLYPPSLGVHPLSSDGDIVSTPSEHGTRSPSVSGATGQGTMSPYNLSHNRDGHTVSPEPDSDFNLDKQSTPGLGNAENSDKIVSPLQRAMSSPVTPPSRPIHRRNTSSLSSGVGSLPSPDPSEDRRRSDYISSLPTNPISPLSPRQKTLPQSFEQHPQEDQELIPKGHHIQSEDEEDKEQ